MAMNRESLSILGFDWRVPFSLQFNTVLQGLFTAIPEWLTSGGLEYPFFFIPLRTCSWQLEPHDHVRFKGSQSNLWRENNLETTDWISTMCKYISLLTIFWLWIRNNYHFYECRFCLARTLFLLVSVYDDLLTCQNQHYCLLRTGSLEHDPTDSLDPAPLVGGTASGKGLTHPRNLKQLLHVVFFCWQTPCQNNSEQSDDQWQAVVSFLASNEVNGLF